MPLGLGVRRGREEETGAVEEGSDAEVAGVDKEGLTAFDSGVRFSR